MRIDRRVTRASAGEPIFATGVPVAVLGRQTEIRASPSSPVTGLRIAPHYAIVAGEGFDPPAPEDVLPAAREKFGGQARWFGGKIERVESPEIFVLKNHVVAVGRDDPVLATRLLPHDLVVGGDQRKAAAKGRRVRFVGKVTAVAFADAPGRPTDAASFGKAGTTVELTVAVARLALLDRETPYEWIETRLLAPPEPKKNEKK